MVSLKLILTISAVILSVQGAQIYNYYAEEIVVFDLISDALALLNKLKDAVSSAIQDAMTTLQGLMDSLNDAAAGIVADLKSQLEDLASGFIAAIKALEEKAAEAAVDITVCVGNSKEEIAAMPTTLLQNLTECLGTKINEAKAIIDNTATDINNTMNDVLAMGDRILECQNKTNVIETGVCLAGETANVTSAIVQFPLKIAADVEKAKLYMATAIPGLAACSAWQVGAMTVDGGAIVANVTACAAELLGNSTAAPTAATTQGTTVNLSTTVKDTKI